MKARLSDEQRQALDQQPEGIEVEDSHSEKVYFLSDAEVHHRAMRALQRQENHDAIQAGIDDMEAGRVEPYEEVSRRLRTHLQEKYGLPLGEA